MVKSNKKFTPAGTNIEEVKRENALAGNGKLQKINEEFAEEIFSQSQPFAGKTSAGTDIQKVKEEIADESGIFPNANSQKRTE